ncbi:MAG: hypothetical protein AAFN13_17215, partial [Bacteroidota bacterium]
YDDPRAPSDEILVLKPDGTGCFEIWNWLPCEIEFFTWETVGPDRLKLTGYTVLELRDDETVGVSDEPPRTFEFDFSIAEEVAPRGERMRVMRVSRPILSDSVFGLMDLDLDHWEAPRFGTELEWPQPPSDDS